MFSADDSKILVSVWVNLEDLIDIFQKVVCIKIFGNTLHEVVSAEILGKQPSQQKYQSFKGLTSC